MLSKMLHRIKRKITFLLVLSFLAMGLYIYRVYSEKSVTAFASAQNDGTETRPDVFHEETEKVSDMHFNDLTNQLAKDPNIEVDLTDSESSSAFQMIEDHVEERRKIVPADLIDKTNLEQITENDSRLKEKLKNEMKLLTNPKRISNSVAMINMTRSRETASLNDSIRKLKMDVQLLPKANDASSSSADRVVIPSDPLGDMNWHYFLGSNDPRAMRIFLKLSSKMNPAMKKGYKAAETQYMNDHHLNALNIGLKWVIMKQFMKSKGKEQRLPSAINIGFKKSGTTAFGWFINEHPQISHSFGNEVHFFDKPDRVVKGVEAYRTSMRFSNPDQIVFEKTPRYLVADGAPKAVRDMLGGDVKFIICVRDPVARAISDFKHDSTLKLKRQWKSNNKSEILRRTTKSEGKRFTDQAIGTDGKVNKSMDSIRTSTFSIHFKNWLSVFPRENFIVLDHEVLAKDAYKELQRVEKFLGLQPYFKPEMFFNNPKRGTCLTDKPRPCPPFSSPGWLPRADPGGDVIKKLRDYFRPYNKEFANIVGRNFSWTDL